MNRHQDVLNLYSVNPRSTVAQLLIKESVPKYVKEEAMEGIIIGKNNILMPSDRDGYMHLYLYNMNGEPLRKIGDGNFDITDVYGMDEVTGDVYYQAAALNPHDRQIYVSHRNSKVERLTDSEGVNSATFSGDYKYFINVWSDYNNPYVFSIRDSKGKQLETLLDNKALKDKLAPYGLANRETFSYTTSEGIKLDGWMVKPANFDTSRKYPVILFQYGGPGNQQVLNSWGSGSMAMAVPMTNIWRSKVLSLCVWMVVAQAAEAPILRSASISKWVNWKLGTKWRRLSIWRLCHTLTRLGLAFGDGALVASIR